MYNLDLIASEMSMFIFENEDLTEREIDIKAEKYIRKHGNTEHKTRQHGTRQENNLKF